MDHDTVTGDLLEEGNPSLTAIPRRRSTSRIAFALDRASPSLSEGGGRRRVNGLVFQDHKNHNHSAAH